MPPLLIESYLFSRSFDEARFYVERYGLDRGSMGDWYRARSRALKGNRHDALRLARQWADAQADPPLTLGAKLDRNGPRRVPELFHGTVWQAEIVSRLDIGIIAIYLHEGVIRFVMFGVRTRGAVNVDAEKLLFRVTPYVYIFFRRGRSRAQS
jgi:hypothetical protein